MKHIILSSEDHPFLKTEHEIPKFMFCEEMRLKHGLEPKQIALFSYSKEDNKQWTGYLRGYILFNSFWIDIVYIQPAYRCLGIGKALFKKLETLLHVDFMQVETFTFQAEGFYKKMGFKEFARIPYFDGKEKIYFKKSLI